MSGAETPEPGLGIEPFPTADPAARAAAARLLFDGFATAAPDAWPTLESAAAEVDDALAAGKIAFLAYAGAEPIGWIGGQPHYDGHVWEVHPLVVRADRRRRGVGRLLLRRLEREVAARGGVTLWIGTDDETERTSVGGIDVYPDVLAHLVRIEDRGGHPFAFYRSLGFEVTGLVPDANGFGKPDILMAKRVSSDG